MTAAETIGLLPDFDSYYVVDRSPEAIKRAKQAWSELEKLKLCVNEAAALVKANRHSLSTSQHLRNVVRASNRQAELKERLTAMQRQLSCRKVEFQACGVIRLDYMERAFYREAERYLPNVAFREIKRRAAERIKRQFAKAEGDDRSVEASRSGGST